MFQSDGSMEPAGRGDADEGAGYDEVDNVPREWYACLLFLTFSSIIRPFLEGGLLILYMFHPPVLLLKTSPSRLLSNFACKIEETGTLSENLAKIIFQRVSAAWTLSLKLNLLEILFCYSVSLSPTKNNFIYWSQCALIKNNFNLGPRRKLPTKLE